MKVGTETIRAVLIPVGNPTKQVKKKNIRIAIKIVSQEKYRRLQHGYNIDKGKCLLILCYISKEQEYMKITFES